MTKTICAAIGLLFIWALPLSTSGQSKPKEVKLKIQAVSYPELTSEITIDLWVNGFLLEEDISNKKNHFVLKLDMNEEYSINVNQPGCMTKIISVDTHYDGEPTGNLTYNIEVYMKKEVIDTFIEDEIFFHLFPGENNKTMLMLAGE